MGHYIWAGPWGTGPSGGDARLKSIPLDPGDYCVTFYLHHIGDNPPPVTVYAEVRILINIL